MSTTDDDDLTIDLGSLEAATGAAGTVSVAGFSRDGEDMTSSIDVAQHAENTATRGGDRRGVPGRVGAGPAADPDDLTIDLPAAPVGSASVFPSAPTPSDGRAEPGPPPPAAGPLPRVPESLTRFQEVVPGEMATVRRLIEDAAKKERIGVHGDYAAIDLVVKRRREPDPTRLRVLLVCGLVPGLVYWVVSRRMTRHTCRVSLEPHVQGTLVSARITDPRDRETVRRVLPRAGWP